MPTKKWIHIAGTYDKQWLKVYMDGVLVNEKPETTAVYYGQNGFVLGQGYHSMFGDNYFIGRMDEVRLWNAARTQQQLISAMRQRLSGMETGLLGYWNFDQSLLDSVVRDKTQYSNNGEISGGATFVLSDAF
jgi:hypothetical protein